MPTIQPAPSKDWQLPAIVAFVYVALAVLAQGQDNNWDLRNYHLYTPIALMEARLGMDIAVAQLQSWHNPTLDFPLAWLVKAGAPGWLVSLWLALPAFIALFFALRLMDLLWPAQRSTFRTWIAGLLAVSGAAVLPSIGTSFNDAFVAAGILPALWWMADSHGKRGAWATWLPIGLLAGAAAGLKLTAAMYCIGFIAAALVAGPLRALPMRILALAIGGVSAAAITAGPWAWHLWQEHANPLFPYFNQWFQSPDALPQPHKDMRFVPVGWYDSLMVPFHLLFESRRYSESRLSDPRLLLGFLALAVWLVRWLRTRPRPLGMAPWPLLAFTLASYAVWVHLYGIYRYVYALELLLAVSFMGVLSSLLPRRWPRTLMFIALVLVVAATHKPSWGRQSFSAPMVSVQFPPLEDKALVLLADMDPLAHAVAFLPANVPALSLRNNFMSPQVCTDLQAKVESRVRAHQGSLYLLRQTSETGSNETPFDVYGLELQGECMPVDNSLQALELCPLTRDATPTAVLCPLPATGH